MSTNQSTITTATESARNSVATAYSKSRSILEGERLAQFGVIVLAVFIFAGLFAPFIVPTIQVRSTTAKTATCSVWRSRPRSIRSGRLTSDVTSCHR